MVNVGVTVCEIVQVRVAVLVGDRETVGVREVEAVREHVIVLLEVGVGVGVLVRELDGVSDGVSVVESEGETDFDDVGVLV